jgi:hypothetical protein
MSPAQWPSSGFKMPGVSTSGPRRPRTPSPEQGEILTKCGRVRVHAKIAT